MADKHSDEGCGTSVVSGESSESTVELNIKTLESEIYTFHVDKNMPVSEFKEKIASEIGLPVGQQRLIFRGKVLKDDHLLSEYHVESGHTLHLVARQPSQSQPSPGTSSGETTANNNRGQDASAGGPRNRIGTISHSVVLGTLNLGDQGEGVVPDLNRVIGAVLNSLGMGNQTATGGVGVPQSTVQAPQGNETEGNNIGVQNQEGSQPPSGQAFFGQSLPQVSQMPPGTAVPVPSLNAPIPDSLNTLSEFMSRMELAFSQNGYEPNQSLPSADPPRVELPSNSRGLPTPEALGIVLRHAQHLFSDQAISALSRIAGRLEQEGSSTDPTVRGQIQTESMQVGLAMQHLGALLLELGRTILTLRMGQSPAESCVNAGPAVYISPSGPNPIMVQPFPLQTSSLFGGSAASPLNPGTFGAAGLGHVPRHVNIHIHTAVGTRGSNGEGTQGERVNGARSGEPGQTLLVPVRNVIATAFPSQTAASASGASQSGVSVSQTPTESASLSTVVAEVNSRIRNLVDNMQSENRATSGGNEGSNQPINHGVSGAGAGGQKTQPAFHESSSSEYASRSLDGDDNPEGATAVPLGLGMGSLQKKRSRLTRAESSSSGGGTSGVSHNQNQQILQTLASLANTRNPNTVPSGYPPPAIGPLGGQSVEGQFDASGIMSQLIQSPALSGLLAGVSEQSGVGSPDVLRNMLQQLTQNPAMRNTINQIAQQVGSQDPGNMFPGIGGGQSGGFDLSRMVQQMMPIVSQALGNTSSIPRSVPGMGPQPWHSERRPVGDQNTNNRFAQIDLQQVVQRIQHQSPPGEIFHALVESVNSSGVEDLVSHLCQEGLDSAYMEILRRDVTHRFQGESESSEES